MFLNRLLRDNLDPERVKEDVDLWTVLEAVQLKATFKSVGLDCDLWKGGSCRLSVGQQQLLCLARAALRPSPLLLLDEPSSALDAEAEQTLYHCLDSVFYDRTILLVAVSGLLLLYMHSQSALVNHSRNV